ncbi:hypothetical protein [Streptomyces sp. NBC_00140]|uniref:hypothetical protein n=1 Tax=Streptomyces sp. NBC_00140 TaxID=2975664 RepID=UPI002253F015|nr:hypothetical protein [Streptomyces sp. NBC_00140]MCX5335490.1 hypothetical protein [Streptomyces sp. NBC_00140]MCX5338330.1 hypothetical protein [Streptomyces sp. NBC_00140]
MSFPAGVATVTLTAGAAGYRALDGEPYVGTIRLTPSVPRVVSAEHGVIALGVVNITVGASGQFTEDPAVLACDADGFSPPFTYRVDEEFTNAPGRAYSILLPAAVPEVALPSLVEVEASDGTVTWQPMNGPAGGDLSGTYPNPTVARINGVAVTGTPTSGQVPTATSSSAATWQTPSAGGSGTPSDTVMAETNYGQEAGAGSGTAYARGDHTHGTPAAPTVGTTAGTYAAGDDSRLSNARTPTGPAGGDLAGTYPNPTLDPSVISSFDAAGAAGAAFDAAVDDAALKYVALAGDQIVTGEKNFTSIPVLPGFNAEFGNQAVRLAQLNEQIATRRAKEPWRFDVTDAAYGAVGDAKVVADGAMSSGSATLTSATAGFTVDDVGKSISIKGAAATGVTTLVTTISAYVSATQVTLSTTNASGGAVSNAIVIWGTDDTPAIQAAVDAAEAYLAAGHTYAQVYCPPRPYVIAGPLNNSKSGNGQIVFGVYPATGVKKILEFASDVTGAAAVRHWQQLVPQYGGACFISLGVYASTAAQTANVNADGNPGVISGPNEGFGYGASALFSNVMPVLTNISFLTTHSAYGLTYGAANFYGCANAHITNFSTGTAGIVAVGSDYSSPGTFGTGLSVGLLLPAPGNNHHVVLDNVSIQGGYTYAFFCTEHALVKRLMILYCWAAVVAVGNYFGSVGSVHAMRILAAGIEACIQEVYIMGVGSGGVGPIVHIDELSTESSTPNVGGQAAHMAAARGWINWAGLFTPGGLTHDNPTGIVSTDGQAASDVRTVTGTLTARPIDRVLKADASGGAVTVNLPSASPNLVTYTIIKADATGNTVTIDPAGGETINGSATRVLSAQWETVALRSDGTNWLAI